uniref:Uncharacterized protein n=1 Tax=Talaromyces marneffei PM1 TaxID=1077442 RepID=A0A093UTL7_TALMA
MRRIRSGRWLDVATLGAGGYAVLESACLKYLVEGLPNPTKQHPQLWAFVGSTQKNKHLHDLFPASTFTRADSGTIRLRGDEATAASDTPVLFADGDPWNAPVLPDSSLASGDRRRSCPACSAIAGSALQSEAFSAVTTFPSEVSRGNLKGLLETCSQDLSGAQLQGFLQSAMMCLAKTHSYTYNFVRATRTQSIPANLGDSVGDFYQKCIEVELPDLDAARFIASALIMDHYSPEMPLMDPTLVFQTLYRPMILATNPFPPNTLVNLIESEMAIEFPHLANYTSLDQRKRLMTANNGHYSAIKSNRIYLYCLVHTAQHFPPCDHALCDLCAQRFGSISVDTEYQFTLDQCLVCCDTTSMIIDVLLPTMDPSILAIDGGGVRGEYLGDCRLQDVFDLDVSTSSGGLTDFGLRALNLLIQECAAIFDRLARCLFEKRRRPAFLWLPPSILGRIRQWYLWWRHDSCYNGSVFDDILQQLYGN